MNNLLYVGIPESDSVRKDILVSAKKVITLLKDHKDYSDLRKQKEEHIMRLKKVLDGIANQTRKLRSALPKTNLGIEPKKNVRTGQHSQRQTEQTSSVPASKIELLEQELEKIEKRLKAFE
ncbi:MAG: hypothetical protein Q7K43_03435 [Candidatus Woesearchaeota archaeon]|nr:hypothetical protein [Candidatus Woesearchaeota archaeon]